MNQDNTIWYILGIVLWVWFGWSLYRAIKPKDVNTISDYGRKWSAYVTLIWYFGGLFISFAQEDTDENAFYIYIVNLIVWPVFAYVLGCAWGAIKKLGKSTVKAIQPKTEIELKIEDEFYSLALQEVEMGLMKKGLWARAIAKTNNEHDAIRYYIKKRVEKMQN
jgi:heme/copper-type cytochrome/quinol oxidase subunit 2